MRETGELERSDARPLWDGAWFAGGVPASERIAEIVIVSTCDCKLRSDVGKNCTFVEQSTFLFCD